MPMLALLLFANFFLIYIPGLLVLGAWLYTVKGTVPGIWTLLMMGLIPFFIGDLIKLAGAAGIAKAIIPKESYNNGENQIGKSGNGRVL